MHGGSASLDLMRRWAALSSCSVGRRLWPSSLVPEQHGLPRSRPPAAAVRAGGQLASFKSDAEFLAFLQKRREAVRRRQANSYGNARSTPAAPAPPPAPQAEAAAADSIAVTGSRAGSDKITNTQEADVDEGGIVKKRGDLLVILRRGRLFTVSDRRRRRSARSTISTPFRRGSPAAATGMTRC